MGQQSRALDVEALRERCRRRGCLDGFFTLSIAFLFVALTALTVCGVTVVLELKKTSSPTAAPPPGAAAPLTYKTENFAFLRTKSNLLAHNFTMQLAPLHHGEGTSVGSQFSFDPDLHALTPRQEGTYFMYVDLTVSCTGGCSAGVLRVEVGEKLLTCDVQLPSHEKSVRRKCWTVTWLHSHKLLTHVTVPAEGLSNWTLRVQDSGVGMFLVA